MEQQVYKSIIDYIKSRTNISKVFQGWQNKVAQPNNVDYAIITMLFQERKGTNIKEYKTSTEKIKTSELLEATLQIDFWGENAYNNAMKIQILLRDIDGVDFLKKYDVAPLYCGNIRNMTGETIQQEQYTKRYGFDLKINYWEEVNQTGEFFNNINLKIKKV